MKFSALFEEEAQTHISLGSLISHIENILLTHEDDNLQTILKIARTIRNNSRLKHQIKASIQLSTGQTVDTRISKQQSQDINTDSKSK